MFRDMHDVIMPTFVLGGLLSLAASGPAATVDPSAPQNPTTSVRRTRMSRKAAASDQPRTSADAAGEAPPILSLLEGLRSGQLGVRAEGTGDGRMTITVNNQTKRTLRVVLPAGLVATGASGQFGGMGGFGGGMGGGMGGMGGGMMGGGGGMGGGMMGGGGMGGGMMGGGGMGGGMGGTMGGRGMMRGGGTMPATMGMMMLGRLIMNLCGDKDSWDATSLYSSMMMGRGMGMMGGMGGMMGGMGGMMGGMGGGFRSVPPTSLPEATLRPNQTRHLPTRLVSLNGPGLNGRVVMPIEGEVLRLCDIDEVTNDSWVRAALRRIAEDKAPPSVAQLALWHVANGFGWDTIAQISRDWANAHELALARQFVAELREQPSPSRSQQRESGTIFWELTTRRPEADTLERKLKSALQSQQLLGLATRAGVPARPQGPALACRIRIDDQSGLVQLSTSDETGTAWKPVGKYRLDLTPNADGSLLTPSEVAEAVAEGLLSRFADIRLIEGKKIQGRPSYQIRIDNASPFILNGLALTGIKADPKTPPSVLAGFSVPPHKNLTVPASAELIERLSLKKGVKLFAADFSAL
jgi:hypothetical protein